MDSSFGWNVWALIIIGIILFIFLAAIGDRGHEFELDHIYNDPNPTGETVPDQTYPLGIQR